LNFGVLCQSILFSNCYQRQPLAVNVKGLWLHNSQVSNQWLLEVSAF
jgi:hypothetical protein